MIDCFQSPTLNITYGPEIARKYDSRNRNGDGAATHLSPLTQKRAKPAVPLGGKYRLVDIPISNCPNGGFRQVYVLTQFNSESLHRHITGSYKFDGFTKHDDINNLEELEIILRASPRAQSLSANLWDGKTLSHWINQRWGVELSARQCQHLFQRTVVATPKYRLWEITAEAVSLEKSPDEKAKTPAENLGQYKSGHPKPGVFLPRTTIVRQQATRRFGKCSVRRQRVSHRWQLR
jgi:hypothetical protein